VSHSQSRLSSLRYWTDKSSLLDRLGLLAEASLRNTRKRPVDLTDVYEVASDAHADEAVAAKSKGKGKAKGKRPAEGEAGEGDKEDGEKDGKKKKVELGMANRNYFAPGPMNSKSRLNSRLALCSF